MKRTLLILIIILPYVLQAQPPVRKKNYPSLLWEISGKGLKKPSFLFGTMHVSSKMAFHLADSFYIGLHKADMVALETNPESWQEDMSRYNLENKEYESDDYPYRYRLNGYPEAPDDYLSINTLKFYKYDKKIERSLYSNPSTINNLLYRSYGNESSDFEEDTYLDMYIYQCGKKWGKKVAGVEKYGESMKLMAEAYRDAARDKNKKDRSYDAEDGYSSGNLQEAYRTGNLDWLDSINRYNSFSSAFDEKFLYKRNEIQASSIDSILRTGQSLFVGVGAAHLPGGRGVIEMLRNMGYRLRPVKMGERDSQHKNQVEKLRVPVVFSNQFSEDGMYHVDIPGKFYKFGDDPSLEQRQYADMANGSYYMVTRIMTNAWMWGHSSDKVYRIVDSLLYENIPGRIISKTPVVRNGYKGIDIINKTRRGDIQRYNIFVTPFEIMIFKMSGTGDYVRSGAEAQKFFGSIRLKEYASASNWKKYSPPYGGFSVNMPHEPYVGNDGSWIYDAEDKLTQTQYRIIRSDINNFRFAEEDSFDLGLMDESFSASEFIDKQLNRKFITWNGYPAMEAQYRDKIGGIYLARFIIQGPHYYTVTTHGKQEIAAMRAFLNSFEIKPFVYKASKEYTDTSLYYTVKSPVFPQSSQEKLDLPRYGLGDGSEEESEAEQLERGVYRGKVIANDSTGEKIFVNFFKSQRYAYFDDSTASTNQRNMPLFGDSSWIVRLSKKSSLSDKTKVWELVLSDTGSSRTILVKSFYRDGIGYTLLSQSDTLTPRSSFMASYFDSFRPIDTLKNISPFQKKSSFFFSDLKSTDSVIHERAIKGLYLVKMDSTDLPQLQQVISSMNWNEKKYLDTKKALIGKLDDIKTRQASDYLKRLYYAAEDTVELQYAVLETLLQQGTKYSMNTFRDILVAEVPVLSSGESNKWTAAVNRGNESLRGFNYNNGNFLDDLYDSLRLTRTILPDLLPLVNLDDYKYNIMHLLAAMIDSGFVTAKDYESYFGKFMLEARQEIKKQSISEKRRAITRAEKQREDRRGDRISYGDDNTDRGNQRLNLYATLLLPFWNNQPSVKSLFMQMLESNDNRLKYRTFLLLLENDKPYPDTLINYFARLDDYRYELYTDLNDAGDGDKFPSNYRNQADLSRSKLLEERAYGAPDSLVFLDKLPATVKGQNGFIYFYKYKNKKDDLTWKIASAGLFTEDPTGFEFDDIDDETFSSDTDLSSKSRYDFTDFSDTRFRSEQPVADQLKKELKRMLYSRRKSAKEFYDKDVADSFDEGEEEEEAVSR